MTTTPRQPAPEDEARAVGRLVGDVVGGLAEAVGTAHRDVAALVDRVVPPAARPWHPASTALRDSVYDTVAATTRVAPRLAADVAARTGRAEALAPSRSGFGRAFLAAVNGLWAPLTDAHPPLSIATAVRVDHQDLVLEPDRVAAAFPDATTGLVVFVHGLVKDEDCWARPDAVSGAGVETYGSRLRAEHGLTPVYVRYHTGRRIQDNAVELADLVQMLVAAWPVPVRDVVLVGHSMGGLVALGAAQQAARADLPWASALRLVATLGTPHHGAPLARALRAGHEALAPVPVVGPITEWLRIRTAGGEDLCDDPHADPSPSRPAVAGLQVTAVSATLTDDPAHPIGRLLGDGLVPVGSAQGHRVETLSLDVVHVRGAGHLALLNHPEVYQHLSARARAAVPGS